RDDLVTVVRTCALPICRPVRAAPSGNVLEAGDGTAGEYRAHDHHAMAGLVENRQLATTSGKRRTRLTSRRSHVRALHRPSARARSEEHTSELQSPDQLV